jgi:hypothetical protein
MTLRNNLADALAKLVCRLRGRHVMGGKYRNVVKGELYPCKPDIFAATYEPVDTDKGGGGDDHGSRKITNAQRCI